MNINKRLSLIRSLNGLSVEELAHKMNESCEKIEKLEEGKLKPSYKFLTKFCEIFDQSIDMLTAKIEVPSPPFDLAIVGRNKKAIFDIERCIYLTPKIFDSIILSECGFHIGIKRAPDREVTNRDRTLSDLGEIEYSAVIDGFGNIRSFDNLRFGYSTVGVILGQENKFFDGVAAAKDITDNMVYLVNYRGEKLSQGYSDIFSKIGGGIFEAMNYLTRQDGTKYLARRVLLGIDGKEIPGLTFDESKSTYSGSIYAEELSDINLLLDYINKYGAGIIKAAPDSIYMVSENYCKIFEAIKEFEIAHSKERGSHFLIALDFLETRAAALHPKICSTVVGSALDLNYIKTGNLVKDIKLKKLASRIIDLLYKIGFEKDEYFI